MKLHTRLLLSNLLGLLVGLGCAEIVASQQSQQFSGDSWKGQAQVKPLELEENSFLGNVNSVSLTHVQKLWLILVPSLLLVGSVSFWLIRSILLPLRKIEQTAKQFSEGDLSARIPPSSITEIRRLELTLNSVADRLQGVEERRHALIRDLAHEMATPLMVIQGYLEMLGSDETAEWSPEVRHLLLEEAEHMSRLMQDLPTLANTEIGDISLQLQPFSPLPALKRMMDKVWLKGLLHESCQLELDCPNSLPQVFADPDRFHQILMNLVGNALAYTPQGKVIVKAWSSDSSLWVAVQDTGIGIAEEELPFIFDRFWRSANGLGQFHRLGNALSLVMNLALLQEWAGQLQKLQGIRQSGQWSGLLLAERSSGVGAGFEAQREPP